MYFNTILLDFQVVNYEKVYSYLIAHIFIMFFLLFHGWNFFLYDVIYLQPERYPVVSIIVHYLCLQEIFLCYLDICLVSLKKSLLLIYNTRIMFFFIFVLAILKILFCCFPREVSCHYYPCFLVEHVSFISDCFNFFFTSGVQLYDSDMPRYHSVYKFILWVSDSHTVFQVICHYMLYMLYY